MDNHHHVINYVNPIEIKEHIHASVSFICIVTCTDWVQLTSLFSFVPLVTYREEWTKRANKSPPLTEQFRGGAGGHNNRKCGVPTLRVISVGNFRYVNHSRGSVFIFFGSVDMFMLIQTLKRKT